MSIWVLLADGLVGIPFGAAVGAAMAPQALEARSTWTVSFLGAVVVTLSVAAGIMIPIVLIVGPRPEWW